MKLILEEPSLVMKELNWLTLLAVFIVTTLRAETGRIRLMMYRRKIQLIRQTLLAPLLAEQM
jgi:hypothetical protein